MKAYGQTNSASRPHDEATGLIVEEFSRNGFAVLEAALLQKTIAHLRVSFDRVLAEQTACFGGEEALRSIDDAGQACALLGDDDVFLSIIQFTRLDAVVNATLGPAALVFRQNGIVMPPSFAEHLQQNWGHDLPYQSWVSIKPIAFGALIVLDNFTSETGSTLFLLGSHRHEDFSNEAFVTRWAHPADAAAGAIVLFDAMCFHCGGVNQRTSPRRAINTIFGISLLAQHVAFRARSDVDAKLLQRLGVVYQPTANIDEWRALRVAHARNP